MPALAASDILTLWEAGHALHPVDRALALLAAHTPGSARDELAALPLGQVDARLLALRAETFGDRLDASAHCPACCEPVEFQLSCAALQLAGHPEPPRRLEHEGYRLELRPLNSFDLASIATHRDVQSASRALMQRCVTEAHEGTRPVAPQSLPDSLCEPVARALLTMDPAAERLLDLRCPQCSHGWQVILDLTHVLWCELTARARRLLLDVHLLARAYGWSEGEVLALSESRRAAYLQLVDA